MTCAFLAKNVLLIGKMARNGWEKGARDGYLIVTDLQMLRLEYYNAINSCYDEADKTLVYAYHQIMEV
jgi:hypothetical protein